MLAAGAYSSRPYLYRGINVFLRFQRFYYKYLKISNQKELEKIVGLTMFLSCSIRPNWSIYSKSLILCYVS